MRERKYLCNCGVAVFTTVVLLVVAVLPAQASLIIEDFSNATTDQQALKTVTGGGSGWADNWGANVGTASSNTLNHTTSNLSPTTASNYAVTQTGTGYADVMRYTLWRGINRIATPLSGTVWFSFIQKNVVGQTGGVQLNNHGVPNSGVDYNRGDFEVGISDSQLHVLWGGTQFLDSTDGHELPASAASASHLIIGALTIGSGNDSIEVWANPTDLYDLDGTAKAYLSVSGADLGDSLDLIGIGGIASGNGNPNMLFDALRFSDNLSDIAFTDVTGLPAVPETMALSQG